MHAPTPAAYAVLVSAALSLSGCQGVDAVTSPQALKNPVITATVTQIPGAPPPMATDMPSAGYEWGGGSDGTALFPVGIPAEDGSAAIPPGRYEVKLSPGAQEGSWMLCDTALCGPAFHENATVIGRPIGPSASAMYIGARSRTLWLDNVTLSRSRDVSP